MTSGSDDQPAWRPLLVSHEGVPSLLVSALFFRTSYILRITDLANIWVESLDRRAIEKRSVDEKSPIDPRQDATQLQVLLGKIEAAFNPSSPDHGQASLGLSCAARQGDGKKEPDMNDLLLQVTCILPQPLAPLRWPIHLTKCAQSSVTSQLVFPLIRAQQARVRQVEDLLSVIRDKDSVITKLADKLEAMGTSMENVFNWLSGKRKVSRALAEDRVRGLARFSEAEFKTKFGPEIRSRNDNQSVEDLIKDAFGGAGLRLSSDASPDTFTGLDDWWTRLRPARTGRGVSLVERHPSPGKEKTPPPQELGGGGDDDFQAQSTPPHLLSARKQKAASRPAPPLDDESTEDEDEPSRIPDSNPPPRSLGDTNPTSSKSQIGTIGKPRRIEASHTPLPSVQAADRNGERLVDESVKDLDVDEEATASDASPSPPPPKVPAPFKTKGGLGIGRIGGKQKAKAPEISSPEGSPPPSSQKQPTPDAVTSPPPRPAHRKLGVIGRKAAPAEESIGHATVKSPETRGRSRAMIVDEEERDKQATRPRETSEERANRKRAELQKELEKKAAAGPAKKKRRF